MPDKSLSASPSTKLPETSSHVEPKSTTDKPVVNFLPPAKSQAAAPITNSTTANSKPLVSPMPNSSLNDDLTNAPVSSSSTKRRFPIWARVLLGIFIFLLVVVLAIAVFLYLYVLPPATRAYQAINRMQVHAQGIQNSIKAKDLVSAKSQLNDVKTDLDVYKQSVQDLSKAQTLPYVGPYWHDAENVGKSADVLLKAGSAGLDAVTPYADLLGLNAESSQEATQTAKDRIDFLVTTLDKIVPQMEGIGADIKEAEGYLKQIDPNRYPERLDEGIFSYVVPESRQDIQVRSQLIQAQSLISQASVLLNDARPLLDVAPYLLGADAPRTYLMLFQNDAEMRPTGGFLTAYAIIKVDKGKITPVLNSDIYDLDSRYTGKDPAPQVLIDYIADPYAKEKLAGQTPVWRLRDRNLSPDFKKSMEDFAMGYAKTGSAKYDGIIGVDTKLLVSLLDVMGPIGVGGYGNFSNEIVDECDCPQIIHELEAAISYETPYIRENRKAILGSVMYSILSNAMGQPKEKVAGLADVMFKSIQQKNIMMYFPDEKIQSAVESFNMAGRVRETASDYLMVVDSNLGGRKSNIYIEEEIDLQVETTEAGTKNTLTVKYKNPRVKDKWLNDDAPTWVRVYVPQGSKLVDSKGSELQVTTTEDLGKTVFSGFFVLRTQGVNTLTFTYETPVKSQPYQILVQKQGGTKNYPLSVVVNGEVRDMELNGDKQLSFE